MQRLELDNSSSDRRADSGARTSDADRWSEVGSNYTLDAAGKRIGEQVKDPGSTLARSLSRVNDALGRVQQTTGRE